MNRLMINWIYKFFDEKLTILSRPWFEHRATSGSRAQKFICFWECKQDMHLAQVFIIPTISFCPFVEVCHGVLLQGASRFLSIFALYLLSLELELS